jgi:hypothetical protein
MPSTHDVPPILWVPPLPIFPKTVSLPFRNGGCLMKLQWRVVISFLLIMAIGLTAELLKTWALVIPAMIVGGACGLWIADA